MRRVKARANTDAVQLREELAGILTSEAVVQINGDVFVDIPDDVDGERVDRIMRQHFPRSFMRDVVDALNAVDFQTPTTFATLKPELLKFLAAVKLLGKAVKSRWED